MDRNFENWDDLTKNPELLKYYELLRSLGVWEYHEYLKNKINRSNKLLDIGIDIFNKDSIEDLLNLVISHLLNVIIPTSMAFILIDESTDETGKTYIHQNMRLASTEHNFIGFSKLKEFFTNYPNPIHYSLLEYKIQDDVVHNQLKIYSPEVIVPIIGIGGFHGIIILSKKILGEEYTTEELAYIRRIMAFASVSIQNNIHHRHAITDRKTHIYNHSFFMNRLDEEISRVQRHNTSLAVVVLDVDHFKDFNDTHGHVAGDMALEELAKVLKSVVRTEDVPARFGGEEFIVLLVNCSQGSAWSAAERIRNSIGKMAIPYKDETLSISVSVGVCFTNKYLQYTSSEVIERADKALYKSKNNGRNQTTLYRPGLYFKAKQVKT